MQIQIRKIFGVLVCSTLLLFNQCKKNTDSTPAPTQVNRSISYLSGILFVDEQKGYMAGGNGVILHTEDGGNTWTHRNTSKDEANDTYANANFVDVFFLDKNNGWAYGTGSSGGIIYKTQDGGVNWTYSKITNPKATVITKVFFIDCNTGFAIGSNQYTVGNIIDLNSYPITPITPITSNFTISPAVLFKTTDGGNTWIVLPLPVSVDLYSIAFSNSQHGFICGASETLLETSDGGNTWTKKSISFVTPTNVDNDPYHLADIIFTNKDTGYIVTTGYKPTTLLKTTDGGDSWRDIGMYLLYGINTQPHFNFPKLTKLSNGGIIAYEDGVRGYQGLGYCISKDGGYNWYSKQINGLSYNVAVNTTQIVRYSNFNASTLVGIKAITSGSKPNQYIFDKFPL